MSKRNQKRHFKSKKLTQSELQAALLRHFRRNPRKRMTAKQLGKKLQLLNTKDSIGSALNTLLTRNLIVSLKDSKFKLIEGLDNFSTASDYRRIEGIVDMTKTGSAYIITSESIDDIYVPRKYLNGAFHNDKVLIETATLKNRRKPEGRVINIIQRANTRFIGALQLYKSYGVVYVNHPKMLLDIIVQPRDLKNAENGDTVIVKIKDFGSGSNRTIRGEVVKILDGDDLNEIEMNSILINNGFELEFSKEIETELLNFKSGKEEFKIDGRRDFRDLITFTIDPADARDYDDAISIHNEDQNTEIGVHIADVSHYVKVDSALDKEAFLRSTSVYLVDRVCPMLPEILSNELCSLKPNVDRLCFSIVLTFDANFKLVKHWIGKGIIHSNHRFSYEEAQKAIDDNNKDLFGRELIILNRIAQKLRKQRFDTGSINFDSGEVQFLLDKNAKPLEIFLKERKSTHLLVEEFMLLANRTVAEFINSKSKSQEIPFIYRIHDIPDMEKLAELALFVNELGIDFKIDSPKNIAKSLNDLASRAKKDERLRMLEPLAIRTMAKAVYSSNNIGHFGLAFTHYTHFTSPIRRYSDLVAHRILEKNLKVVFRTDKAKLEEQCTHISNQERKAQEAERDSVKFKQVEYMEKFKGEEFNGRISAFMDRGMFIELENTLAEGLIRFNSLPEAYTTSLARLKAIGQRTGRIYKIGDSVKVKLIDTDPSLRKIYFKLLT